MNDNLLLFKDVPALKVFVLDPFNTDAAHYLKLDETHAVKRENSRPSVDIWEGRPIEFHPHVLVTQKES